VARTEGTGGRTASTVFKMSERPMEELIHVNRLCESRLATIHAESRTATAATATPRAESMGARLWRFNVALLSCRGSGTNAEDDRGTEDDEQGD